MAEKNKAEVNLEVSTGFFRIATEQANYNITVLGGFSGPAVLNHGEPVVAVQRIRAEELPLPKESDFGQESQTSEVGEDGEEYYKKVSEGLFSDIGKLAKQLSHTIMEIPAEDRLAKRVELDQAGERIEEAKNQLKDIVAMTEQATMEIMDRVDKVQAGTNDLKSLLSFLRSHQAFKIVENQAALEEKNEVEKPRVIDDLRARLVAASALAATLNTGGGAVVVPVDATKQSRYLFQIDPVLQTMYELCTNETVKTHITAARKTAEKIFSRDIFIDQISPKVGTLPVEDGFITVPMPDVLSSLNEACSDKAIKNLLKNMESKMDQIFLDQSLPLEAPAVEEPAAAVAAPPVSTQSAELVAMLDEAVSLVDGLAAGEGGVEASGIPGMSGMTFEDQREIFTKIESAFDTVSNISSDVFRITESLSFQDLSGQQILKIIKLLSDFQIQLLAMVVSFGSQLKNKEKHVNITAEESKKMAQNDVDAYLNKITGGTKAEGEASLLDQEAVNSMLQEFGF